MKKLQSTILALSIVSTVAVAQALDITGMLKSTGTVNTDNSSNSTSVQNSIQADLGAGQSASNSNSSSSNSSNSGSVNVSGQATVNLNRTDISEDLNSSVNLIIAPASVTGDAELSSYARNIIRSDSRVESVNLTPDNVEVEYKAMVKLLGLIPYTTTATIEVDSNGEVDVKYPWYSALSSSKHKDEMKAAIEADVQAILASSNSTGQASIDASTKAKLLNVIYMAMKNNYDASATADIQ